MRIAAVDVFPFSVPLKRPFQIATMTSYAANGVFVAIRTDDGRTGWGEANPLASINGETQGTCLAAVEHLAPWLVGQDPRQAASLSTAMRAVLDSQAAARAALDMALYDLAAQAAGLPLYAYLGGVERDLPTDVTIGIMPPEEAAEQALAIVEDGFQRVKIKLGSGLADDVERVAAVAQSVPESVYLRVDANQGYLRDDALTLLEHLGDVGIEFCEQPVARHDWDGMAYLVGRSPIPIMADESLFSSTDAQHLIQHKACTMMNVKLSKSGGIREGWRIAEVAASAGIPCMMGGMVETRLGVTAAAHLACAHGSFRFFDLDSHMPHAEDPIEGGVTYEGGLCRLPSAPGLGAKPSGLN